MQQCLPPPLKNTELEKTGSNAARAFDAYNSNGTATLESSHGSKSAECLYCLSDENNAIFSNYLYNVGRLFNQKLDDGGSKSIYYGENPNKVYGNYLCRFDTTHETCQDCISKATDRLVKECKSNKAAIIWFDRFTMCFSNRSFYSTLNTYPAHSEITAVNFTLLDVFAEILNQTFNKTIAVLFGSNYGIHNAIVSNNKKVYTLVQCLPDLSTEDYYAYLYHRQLYPGKLLIEEATNIVHVI
ncbi:hypothetical protein Dsin_016568 [Dipteronia sinensis]|uniref:Gnk2-homologous domain-containing protein n=1 Tax=Dipteronia sinensis TaxID=43782 RepID=A0AAE0AEM4_9ROSI|nr:hypothetical protein Dsin_016568 [Dipteronia sinensis]